MVNRGMSTQLSTELTNPEVKIYHLYEGQFPDGTVRFTDLPYDTTFNSQSFLGAGSAIGFDSIEEVAGLNANGVNIYFNASNATLLAVLLDQNLIDRPVMVYRGLLDSNNKEIADPVVIFEGRSDNFTVAENPDNGNMTAKLSCFDENVDFQRVNGRRTNDEEQQSLFAGDLAFQFIADGADKVTVW